MVDFLVESAVLAATAQQVIALRLFKLSQGGMAAQHEAHRMVAEKIDAAGEAMFDLATGGSAHSVMRSYQRRVSANISRLSR
jgi:hypothetical protein